MSNFFGVGNEDTVVRWQDRVQRMHATSRLVGRGYKQPCDTPDSMFVPTAIPATAPVNQLPTTAHIRDPYRRYHVDS